MITPKRQHDPDNSHMRGRSACSIRSKNYWDEYQVEHSYLIDNNPVRHHHRSSSIDGVVRSQINGYDRGVSLASISVFYRWCIRYRDANINRRDPRRPEYEG